MKKQTHKKIGVQKPAVKQEPRAKVAPLTKRHFHYGVTQHFTIDVQDLDEDYGHLNSIWTAVVSHPEIMAAICEFEALSAMEDTYVSECYGDMNYYIGNILAKFLDCFSEEDQEYIRKFKDEYDTFSALGECFKSKSEGFEVNEYVYHDHDR